MARFLETNQFILNISENYQELCDNVTERILAFSNEKIAIQGRFTIVLSGGSTPKGIYRCMVMQPYRKMFQWEKIHFFFSDERWVSREDKKSNYRMVNRVLFSKVNIPKSNIHPIQTKDCTLQESSLKYEQDISNFFELKNDEFPRFDLILLGLGLDGHTSSLFPGNEALLAKSRLAIDVSDKKLTEQRVTLSLPVINMADMVIFVVSGEPKAGIVHQVLENDGITIYPANEIQPIQGELCWYLDKDAASQINNLNIFNKTPKRIGIAADHAGYGLKEELSQLLRDANFEVIDFGDQKLNLDDDYPDYVVPLARAVAGGQVDRGVAICGSGVGVCIAANRVAGVRACLITEEFSAQQGVEDDNLNIICLGSIETKKEHAWKLVSIFLASHFSGAQRHQRRLSKVAALERLS